MASVPTPFLAEISRKTPVRENDSAAFKMALEASIEGNSREIDLCGKRKQSSPGNRRGRETPGAPRISPTAREGEREPGWAVNYQDAGLLIYVYYK